MNEFEIAFPTSTQLVLDQIQFFSRSLQQAAVKITKIEQYLQTQLLAEMKRLSKKHTNLAWAPGYEFILWSNLSPEYIEKYGRSEISPQDLRHLRHLAEVSAGWWHRTEEDAFEFLPTEQWLELYQTTKTMHLVVR